MQRKGGCGMFYHKRHWFIRHNKLYFVSLEFRPLVALVSISGPGSMIVELLSLANCVSLTHKTFDFMVNLHSKLIWCKVIQKCWLQIKKNVYFLLRQYPADICRGFISIWIHIFMRLNKRQLQPWIFIWYSMFLWNRTLFTIFHSFEHSHHIKTIPGMTLIVRLPRTVFNTMLICLLALVIFPF